MMSRFVRTTAVVAMLTAWCLPSALAHADSSRAGDAIIVEGSDQTRPLEHGASAAVFALRLPDGASCPGDSAHDGWRVQSFMVPDAVDPGTLTYLLRQPKGEGLYPLFSVNGAAFVQQGTAVNDKPGSPAKITALPTFNFAKFTPGLLPNGTYRIGIACTIDRTTKRYWDARVVITQSSSDKPAGIVWRTPSAPAGINRLDEPSNTGTYIAIGVLVVLALAGAAIFARSRRARLVTTTSSTPSAPRVTTSSKE
jgi:hypothetical protein